MDDQEPLIVNLPALTPASCKHVGDNLAMPGCVRDVDAATTDSNGNNTDASFMSEEFECGVPVSGPETAREEWSFTLYDFDGQGNITKEGLATLLKTLYDAVGTTVNKQRQNTKSLRLRLTLSPDASQAAGKTSPAAAAADSSNKSSDCAADRLFRSKDIKVKMNNLLQTDKVTSDRLLRNGRTADIMTRNNVSTSHSAAKRTVPASLLSTDRDKNSYVCCQGTPAKACAVNVDNQASDEATANNNRRVLRSRRCVSSHFDNSDRRNHYLDLAGVREVDSVNVMTDRSMAAGIAAVASPRASRQQTRRSQHQQQQLGGEHVVDKDARFVVKMPMSRSAEHCQQRDVSCSRRGDKRENDTNNERSCGVPIISNDSSRLGGSDDCATRVVREAERPTHRLRCASCSAAASARIREQAYIVQDLTASASPQLKHDVTQATAAAASVAATAAAAGKAAQNNNCSPLHYHHRHKNRARNQTRAMRQVMDWLEDAGKPATSLPPRELVVIQRHEHHHIHEYHHHHYHHYDEKQS